MTTPQSTDRATPTNAYAPPKAPLTRPTGTESSQSATSTTPAQRIAGALFIVGATLSIIWTIARGGPVLPPLALSIGVFPLFFAFATSIGPLVVIGLDIVLGMMLLAKKKRAVPWAILRILVGLILFGVAQLWVLHRDDLDPTDLLWKLVVSGSLLMLLARNASKPRIVFGTALFGLHTVVTLWALGVRITGANPVATLIETSSGNVSAEPVKVVIGKAVPYKLTIPSDKWHLRTDKPNGEDDSGVDRWISRPDVDAHVMVIVDDAPTSSFIPDEFANATIKELEVQGRVVPRQRTPLRTHPERGRLMQLEVYSDRMTTEWFVGTVLTYQRGFVIYAFASRQVFKSLESELRSIVESFELPPDEAIRIPDDWEKGPVTRVEGITQKYVITAPSENCFLRKRDAVTKLNPRADRWLVCPDKGAEIIVIVEEAKDGVIDLEKYTDSIVEDIALDAKERFISREASKSRPSIGRIVHTTTVTDGVEYEHLYGLFVEGPRVFQIIAYARAEMFGQLKVDFTRMIEQFELPRQ